MHQLSVFGLFFLILEQRMIVITTNSERKKLGLLVEAVDSDEVVEKQFTE